MKNTTITKRPRKVATTIRLDPELKNWAREYAEYLGIDLSTLITMILVQKRNVEEGKIPPF